MKKITEFILVAILAVFVALVVLMVQDVLVGGRQGREQVERLIAAIENPTVRVVIVDSREMKDAVADVINAATESVIREEMYPRLYNPQGRQRSCIFCGDLASEWEEGTVKAVVDGREYMVCPSCSKHYFTLAVEPEIQNKILLHDIRKKVQER